MHRSLYASTLARITLTSTCLLVSPGLEVHLAHAQSNESSVPSTFVLDDDDPVASVPSEAAARAKPLEMGYFLMELSDRAAAAEARGEHARAAQYYRAMAKAVPDRATGFSRACAAHAKAAQWDQALEVCRVALATPGLTREDLVMFVQVMLARDEPFDTHEIEEVDAVLTRLVQTTSHTHAERLALEDLACRVAVRLEDETRLRKCNAEMAALAPNTPKALVYAAALALQQQDWLQAERVIARARRVGVAPEALSLLEKSLAERKPAPKTHPRMVVSDLAARAGASVVIMLVGLSLIGLARKRRPQST
jgi:hypothetical protein